MEDRRLPHYLPGVKTGARVGNLKLDLPVDEDDYLMPSPSQSTQPHHGGYMDLIGDAKLGGRNIVSFNFIFLLFSFFCIFHLI